MEQLNTVRKLVEAWPGPVKCGGGKPKFSTECLGIEMPRAFFRAVRLTDLPIHVIFHEYVSPLLSVHLHSAISNLMCMKKEDVRSRNSKFCTRIRYDTSFLNWVCLKIGYIPNEIAI